MLTSVCLSYASHSQQSKCHFLSCLVMLEGHRPTCGAPRSRPTALQPSERVTLEPWQSAQTIQGAAILQAASAWGRPSCAWQQAPLGWTPSALPCDSTTSIKHSDVLCRTRGPVFPHCQSHHIWECPPCHKQFCKSIDLAYRCHNPGKMTLASA